MKKILKKKIPKILKKKTKIPEILKKKIPKILKKITKLFRKISRYLNLCHFFSNYLPLASNIDFMDFRLDKLRANNNPRKPF